MIPHEVQARTDTEQLRLLSIGYYVAAGLSALFLLFPLIYVGLGLAIVSGRWLIRAGAWPWSAAATAVPANG